MPPRVQNASPKTAKSKAGSAASSPQSDPPQQSSKQKKKGTTAKGNDLTVTQKVSREERAAWWESCNGQCVVCGMRFQHPLRDKLRPYSDIDTLLFKYNILQKIEMGHLIDNYILDNAKLFAADLPAHAKICQLKPLDLDETQLKHASEKLSVLIQEAKAHMLPVCKDCNSTMTTERTELISALEGSNIDPGWFVGDKMPTTLRKNARDKNSPAKLLQSLVMFFAVNLDTSRQCVQMAVKEKADVWRDACVTKTVSHLMQWGRRRQWRHLALCIFWSAYYVWICFLNEEQQTVMDFGTWYSFVFRPYYQHYFAPGSWFGHDVLVISQVTNPNASMFVFTGDSTAPNWHAWVCKQVETVAADVIGVCRYVFSDGEDRSGMRHVTLEKVVPTKSAVCTAVTRMREHGNTAQGVFVDLYGAASPHTAAIDDYFRWYLAMSAGAANVRAQYQCFTIAANRVLRMHWKNKSKSRSSKLDWSDIGTDVSYLLPRD